MLCKQARNQIEHMSHVEESTAELTDHLAQCRACRELIADFTRLQDAMAQLRSDMSRVGPSRSTELGVLAALDGRGSRISTDSNRAWRWFVAGALASAVMLVVGIRMDARRDLIVEPTQTAEEQFTAMPYVVPPAPYERTYVVRTEIPFQIIASAGFQPLGEDPSSTALADVLYGEDGRILALRLVSQPDTFSTTRMD